MKREQGALLIVTGAMGDGTKEVLPVERGVREFTEAWKGVLRSLDVRGPPCPRLTVAHGHLGICGAPADVYTDSAEQRCRNHKVLNVPQQLPRAEQPWAQKRGMAYAEAGAQCERL